MEPSPLLEVIVPAYNEAERLPGGLHRLCAKLAELPVAASVLVVDNGSTDETAEIAREWPPGPVPVHLLRCPTRGKGAAVRAGLLSTTAPIVGFCDADMATDLDAFDTVLAMLGRDCPVVIGSRAHALSTVEARHSSIRRLGAWVFRAMARAIVPGVDDTQCGFKFFQGDLARRAAARQTTTGFAFDIELLAWCRRLGAPVRELPIAWRDVPGSRFSVLRHGAGIFAAVARIWWVLRAAEAPRATHDDPVATPTNQRGTRSAA